MTKPTLVLLHGVGLDHTMWEPVAALLADDVEVLAPDLPGHGSRPPAPDGVTLAGLADGVVAEVPPGSHLVGFSLGALIAQHLAVHRPELVATLTSVSSVCRRTPAEREAVLARLRTAEADFRASAAASLRRWYDGTDVDAAWVRGGLEDSGHRGDPSCSRVPQPGCWPSAAGCPRSTGWRRTSGRPTPPWPVTTASATPSWSRSSTTC
jgi:pimeloyl-ACP methyl ester carboxylesterase